MAATEEASRSADALQTTLSLEDLQTDAQRQVLDTITEIRKCGLDGILELPQLVVCGDQSAGKSSVLEALTEIPFPRNDNLCTRFATEISLRRASTNSLIIKVIPDDTRPDLEKASIKDFKEAITDFDDLPRVMDLAMKIMGIDNKLDPKATPQAFAKDVLSIIIEGPTRPQLNLVDIPGLIATHTKGTTIADVEMVAEITDRYITQRRTICLAVVSATSDYANQKTLEKVRQVDPKGERTLGIITKPDRLERGSGSEKGFIELANNKDGFFQLGWHVLKNRSFDERDCDLTDRNTAEETFFRTSSWKDLLPESRGIQSLRGRLASLLFQHVKKELPKLKKDLEALLSKNRKELQLLGCERSSVADFRSYLTLLSMDFSTITEAAVNGNYNADYFYDNMDYGFSLDSPATLRRVRAVKGHKFQINIADDFVSDSESHPVSADTYNTFEDDAPKVLTKKESMQWALTVLSRNRGRELLGNFNPLVVGELFRRQSWKWETMAKSHIILVWKVCITFLRSLLEDKCPKEVAERIWSLKIEDALKSRNHKATQELATLVGELKNYPINYNHYYTDTVEKCRQDWQKSALTNSITAALTSTTVHISGENAYKTFKEVDVKKAVSGFSNRSDPNMESFSCREALDSLLAIYKVQQKTFVANVTTQVVERHIVRGLETIFTPLVVINLSDAEVLSIARESVSVMNQRKNLEDQISRLEKGQEIFRRVM
ncbi:Interferon-induced GTP-binding Mx1 [Hyphodiscus hymeniophilus]|uniref:Interferon-induced GTP-binding Mx1 n=1 Tax=Hyphodiscus hymeniophilus TaxID=353542 RepID=A0A9P6VFM8_9HELO|nr:Interferon-induced GTP-binding Mx1 [Hyphodiscus hymeniophilus]